MIECPLCAEMIEPKSVFCPFCSEKINYVFSADEQNELVDALRNEMKSYERDRIAQSNDIALSGGLLSRKSKVLLGFMVAFIALSVAAFARLDYDEAGIFGGFSISVAFIFLISFLVAFVNDHRANKIQKVSDPAKALKLYLKALATGRYNKAYASVVPSRRAEKRPELPSFTNIPFEKKNQSYSNLKEYSSYWKYALSGLSSQTQTVAIKSVRTIQQKPDGLAIVEVKLAFSSYSNSIMALIFLGGIGLLIAMLIILAITKKDEFTINKLMIKQNGKWFFAEGAFQGPLDGITQI